MDISRRLYSAAQVRELDRRAIAAGIPGYTLMQRAAGACWQQILDRWPQAQHIHVVCGSGNNGGDGFEIARLALLAGREVRVWQVGDPPKAGDAMAARQAWLQSGGAVSPWTQASLAGAQVVVDALFGIGLTREIAGETAAAVAAINASAAKVLAVDLPSGLDADSGRVWGAAVRANVTVTFIGRKLGLYTGLGPECAGEVVFDPLEVPAVAYAGLEPPLCALHEDDLCAWLPRRARAAHKGSHGHVLVVGGDEGMMGAALLAASAALRAGAGLVSVATRAGHAAAMAAARPELMCRDVGSARELAPLIKRASAIAIGPGLGQNAWGRTMLACVLEQQRPLVADADALNLLAQEPLRCDNWVLTPHPGEAARLLGLSTGKIQDDRLAAVRRLQEKYGGVAVLKGAGTLVQGRQLMLCPYGNPGMAAGGMGDVLSGVIAALIAQGLSLEDAANAGVLTHALAGDRAAGSGERGLLPSDLLAELRAVVNP